MSAVRIAILLLALSIEWLAPGNAAAQQMVFSNNLQLSPDQKLMLEAAAKTVGRDYKSAESLYSQAIAANSSNIDAYLQRGIIRRELGDAAGTASDGQTTVTLADIAIRNSPGDANLYYKRGMGFRLLKNYDQAEQDITTAIKLGGQPSWNTDLQAVALEKKAGR